MRPDGGDRRLLARDAQSPDWSPDGSRVALVSVRDRNETSCGSNECSIRGEIYFARADGGGLRRLTNNTGDDGEPRWSPDGARLLFASTRNFPEGESPELYSMTPAGGCLTWLTNGTPGSSGGAWRPGPGPRTDAGGCGSLRRKPLVETVPRKAARGSYWLGAGYRGLLLSDFDDDRKGTHFGYDDCGRFRARDCPPGLQVFNTSVCARDAYFGFTQTDTGRVLRRRGALALDLLGDGGGLDVFTGATEVSLRLEANRSATQDRRELGAHLRRLSRFGRPLRRGGRLPPPQVSRGLAAKLRRTVRAKRRYGSSRVAAMRLGIRPGSVRRRLRLAHALGAVRAARCLQR